MKNWRPANWENPYYEIPEGNDRCIPGDQGAFEFEAGADAMYEPAYEKGGKDMGIRLLKYLKGLLGVNPKASLAATIDLIETAKPEEAKE